MELLYNLSISLYVIAIRLAALAGNKKASLWISGRRNWQQQVRTALEKAGSRKRFLFHCASLGEFEQGRSLIERVRKEFPDAFIVLSFFSPSGYEHRKNYDGADFVTYLPADTKSNASVFLDIIRPEKIFFIKYEFWLNFINVSFKKKIPMYVVSAIFREKQIFFRSYGRYFLNQLKKIDCIFLQDENSSSLLKKAGIENTMVTGDTRFDRVIEICRAFQTIPVIEEFSKGHKVIAAGSSWPEDEDLLLDSMPELKSKARIIFIPHEPDNTHIKRLTDSIRKRHPEKHYVLFSEYKKEETPDILIVDRIGMLSRIYHYCTIAYIGGGFGKGIHNTLEAAAHGKPVLFGPVYDKFREAVQLIETGGAFSIRTASEASTLFNELMNNEQKYSESSKRALQYTIDNAGATERIYRHVFSR
ncbi:MAG: glycosyltransferase N-terminal domain-containing protein [Bacteroidia bacterium]